MSLGARELPRVPVQRPDHTVSVRIGELLPGDEARLRRTYGFVRELYEHLREHLHDDDGLGDLAAWLEREGLDHVHDGVAALGQGLRMRDDVDLRLRKAYHDLRGGSLLALLMHLELVGLGSATHADLVRSLILARDQLKIMRNTVPDLDPARYHADLQNKDHSVDLLRDKWSSVAYRRTKHGLSVDLDCAFEGVIASCCMEFSTLDRVLYNLVNNAAVYAADGVACLSVLPMDDRPETMLRIAVTNRVEPEHRRRLAQRFGDDFGDVFDGGFTSGTATTALEEGHGYGLGLRICGDLVTQGLGLPSVSTAVLRGYLGATLVEDWFAVWFHWPARRTAAAAPSGSAATPRALPQTQRIGRHPER